MSKLRRQIEYAARFKKDLKRLYKKYRNIRGDLQPLIDQLQQGATPGDQVPDVGYSVYKVRLRNTDTGKGKSGG